MVLALLPTGPYAAPGPAAPTVALIIDDLGYRRREGERAIALPGHVSFSFLPDTPYAFHLATLAHRKNREILLHLPMESLGGQALLAFGC